MGVTGWEGWINLLLVSLPKSSPSFTSSFVFVCARRNVHIFFLPSKMSGVVCALWSVELLKEQQYSGVMNIFSAAWLYCKPYLISAPLLWAVVDVSAYMAIYQN